MKKVALTLISVFAINLCFGQFHQCNNVDVQSDLWDVYFINENIGLIVGEEGTILRTTDGGENWDQVMSSDTIDFRKVAFFDDEVGIALGSHLFKTIDGGVSWVQLNVPNKGFIDIAILNNSSCVITGFPTGVLKSLDRGENWYITVAENDPYYHRDYGWLSFVDENIGYTISNMSKHTDYFFKTIDGGENWDTIFVDIGVGFTIFEAFEFTTEGKGWKSGWYEYISRQTKDGGATWEEVDKPYGYCMMDIHIDEDRLFSYYASGRHGRIYKSDNKGESWEIMTIDSLVTEHLNAIHFINDSIGWIVGQNGIILSTAPNAEICNKEPEVEVLEIMITPNPTSGLLTISKPEDTVIQEITVWDMEGRLLKRINHESNSTISLEEFSRGMYIVKLLTENDEIVERIIVQ